jgi:DNA-binding NtrC family response regulator
LRRPHEGLSALADREIEMIEAALAESHGRIAGPSGAAAKLGIPRQTLESKIKRLGSAKCRTMSKRQQGAKLFGGWTF